MKISDVMKETGLTRKSIYYYEEVGLISPTKEDENSYRNYSESDLERLKQIKTLRLLDVSLQQIKDIFDNSLTFNEIMEEQLGKIKEKIKVLNETENIIKLLINDKDNSTSFSYNLDKLNHYLDLGAKASKDYMKKELERIFPSGFGKLMAVMYGPFLDEPINTKEKEESWTGFVKVLDSTEEVKFPEEITAILDRLYNNVTKEGLEEFESQTGKIINNVISFSDQISTEEMANIDKKIKDGQNQEGYSELMEMSKKLFEFVKANPNILPPDFSNYLKILSSKYSTFGENISKAFKNKYTIGKTFGGI